MYAINVADLTALKQQPEHAALAFVLAAFVSTDPNQVVECERGKVAGMGHGALFTKPDDQVQALIALIRQRFTKTYQLRIYHSATGKGGWKRV